MREKLFFYKQQQLDTLTYAESSNLLLDLTFGPGTKILSFDNYMIFHLSTSFDSIRDKQTGHTLSIGDISSGNLPKRNLCLQILHHII